jgi:hypothetical protein
VRKGKERPAIRGSRLAYLISDEIEMHAGNYPLWLSQGMNQARGVHVHGQPLRGVDDCFSYFQLTIHRERITIGSTWGIICAMEAASAAGVGLSSPHRSIANGNSPRFVDSDRMNNRSINLSR